MYERKIHIIRGYRIGKECTEHGNEHVNGHENDAAHLGSRYRLAELFVELLVCDPTA